MEIDLQVKIIDKGYKITRDVYIFRSFGNSKGEILRSDGWKEFNMTGAEIEPSFEASPEVLQELANSLSQQGFKPEKGFLEGKIEATEKHLEDMRELVFKS